jgi:ZIP family zinc transporter
MGSYCYGICGVFLTKEVNRKILDGMLGFANGVMISASYFSLITPAMRKANLHL